MAPTACSSVMEGGGLRWASLLGRGAWKLQEPGLPPSLATLPSPFHKALGLAPGVASGEP